MEITKELLEKVVKESWDEYYKELTRMTKKYKFTNIFKKLIKWKYGSKI